MDPITHGLIGAAAVQAFHPRAFTPRMALAGAAGAMLPDLDVLIRSSTDPLVSIEFHRNFTHSLLFIPAGGFIAAVLLWLLFRRKTPLFQLCLAATLGYATHPLLDACTTYGTLLLWPFSMQRISWDLISIIDPVVTLALILGILFSWRKKTRLFARVALGFVLAYLAFGFYQHRLGMELQHRVAQQRDQRVERGRVIPTFGNLLLWRSIYQSGGRIYADAFLVKPWGKWKWWPGSSLPKFMASSVEPPPPRGSILQEDLTRYGWFSEEFLGVLSLDPLVLGDLRFSLIPNGLRPIWGITFLPWDPQRHVVKLRFPWDRGQAFTVLWEMLKGHAPGAQEIPAGYLKYFEKQ